MNLYSDYNKIFFIYKESRYLHYCNNGYYINLPLNQIGFNLIKYSMIQHLFHSKENNVTYYYYYIHNSYFFNDIQIKEMKELYKKVQKFKFAFSRFKHIVYLKYKKKFNNTTLLFEPFPEKRIKLYENNKIYQFTYNEIYKMIENCFNYSSYGIPVILDLKNPYTNIKFTLYNLIYIYFELLKEGKNSLFFTLYFKSNFNKDTLLDIYQPQLYVNCLSKEYYTFRPQRKKVLLFQMINYNDKYKNFINVNTELLHKIFESKLKYYYIYKKLIYNFSEEKYENLIQYYEDKFKSKLEEVYRKNPLFGRRTFRKNLGGNYETIINEIYLNV